MNRLSRTLLGIVFLTVAIATIAACGSPAPAAAPTPAPGPAPAGGLKLEVTPVLDGKADQETTVTATTAPGAKCTIQVTNPKTGTLSSYPKDKERVADASGKAVWTWTIHRQVAKGDGKITVTAELGGEKVTKEAVFRVIQSEY